MLQNHIRKMTIINNSALATKRSSLMEILGKTALTLLLATSTTPIIAVTSANAAKAVPVKKATPADKPVDNKAGGEKKDDKQANAKPAPEPVLENIQKVSPLDLVDKPHEYVGKNVKFIADFYAFTSLALDYKPALRPSKTHLSFLLRRPNSHIPLSELKIAMAIPKEKDPENLVLTSLKEGDELEIDGKVFSAALDEPWVDVVWFKKLKSEKEDKKEDDVAKNDNASEDKNAWTSKSEKKTDPDHPTHPPDVDNRTGH